MSLSQVSPYRSSKMSIDNIISVFRLFILTFLSLSLFLSIQIVASSSSSSSDSSYSAPVEYSERNSKADTEMDAEMEMYTPSVLYSSFLSNVTLPPPSLSSSSSPNWFLLGMMILLVFSSLLVILFSLSFFQHSPWSLSSPSVPKYKIFSLQNDKIFWEKMENKGNIRQKNHLTQGVKYIQEEGENHNENPNKTPIPIDLNLNEMSLSSSPTSPFDFDGFDFASLYSLLDNSNSFFFSSFSSQNDSLENFYENISSQMSNMKSLLSVKMSTQILSQKEGITECLDRIVSGEIQSRKHFADFSFRNETNLLKSIELLSIQFRLLTEDYNLFPIKQLIIRLISLIDSVIHSISLERERRKTFSLHVEIVGKPILDFLSQLDQKEQMISDEFTFHLSSYANSVSDLMDKISSEEQKHFSALEKFDDGNGEKKDLQIDKFHLTLMRIIMDIQYANMGLDEKVSALSLQFREFDEESRESLENVIGEMMEKRKKYFSENGKGRIFRGINAELSKVLTGLLSFRGGVKANKDNQYALEPIIPFDPKDPFSPIMDPGVIEVPYEIIIQREKKSRRKTKAKGKDTLITLPPSPSSPSPSPSPLSLVSSLRNKFLSVLNSKIPLISSDFSLSEEEKTNKIEKIKGEIALFTSAFDSESQTIYHLMMETERNEGELDEVHKDILSRIHQAEEEYQSYSPREGEELSDQGDSTLQDEISHFNQMVEAAMSTSSSSAPWSDFAKNVFISSSADGKFSFSQMEKLGLETLLENSSTTPKSIQFELEKMQKNRQSQREQNQKKNILGIQIAQLKEIEKNLREKKEINAVITKETEVMTQSEEIKEVETEVQKEKLAIESKFAHEMEENNSDISASISLIDQNPLEETKKQIQIADENLFLLKEKQRENQNSNDKKEISDLISAAQKEKDSLMRAMELEREAQKKRLLEALMEKKAKQKALLRKQKDEKIDALDSKVSQVVREGSVRSEIIIIRDAFSKLPPHIPLDDKRQKCKILIEMILGRRHKREIDELFRIHLERKSQFLTDLIENLSEKTNILTLESEINNEFSSLHLAQIADIRLRHQSEIHKIFLFFFPLETFEENLWKNSEIQNDSVEKLREKEKNIREFVNKIHKMDTEKKDKEVSPIPNDLFPTENQNKNENIIPKHILEFKIQMEKTFQKDKKTEKKQREKNEGEKMGQNEGEKEGEGEREVEGDTTGDSLPIPILPSPPFPSAFSPLSSSLSVSPDVKKDIYTEHQQNLGALSRAVNIEKSKQISSLEFALLEKKKKVAALRAKKILEEKKKMDMAKAAAIAGQAVNTNTAITVGMATEMETEKDTDMDSEDANDKEKKTEFRADNFAPNPNPFNSNANGKNNEPKHKENGDDNQSTSSSVPFVSSSVFALSPTATVIDPSASLALSRLSHLESLVLALSSQVNQWRNQNYVDWKDTQIQQEEKRGIDNGICPSEEFSLSEMFIFLWGKRMVSSLFLCGPHSIARDFPFSVPQIVISEVLKSPLQSISPYKNSFYFDSKQNILFIRKCRLKSAGEFMMVVTHCMAHIAADQIVSKAVEKRGEQQGKDNKENQNDIFTLLSESSEIDKIHLKSFVLSLSKGSELPLWDDHSPIFQCLLHRILHKYGEILFQTQHTNSNWGPINVDADADSKSQQSLPVPPSLLPPPSPSSPSPQSIRHGVISSLSESFISLVDSKGEEMDRKEQKIFPFQREQNSQFAQSKISSHLQQVNGTQKNEKDKDRDRDLLNDNGISPLSLSLFLSEKISQSVECHLDDLSAQYYSIMNQIHSLSTPLSPPTVSSSSFLSSLWSEKCRVESKIQQFEERRKKMKKENEKEK